MASEEGLEYLFLSLSWIWKLFSWYFTSHMIYFLGMYKIWGQNFFIFKWNHDILFFSFYRTRIFNLY